MEFFYTSRSKVLLLGPYSPSCPRVHSEDNNNVLDRGAVHNDFQSSSPMLIPNPLINIATLLFPCTALSLEIPELCFFKLTVLLSLVLPSL